MPMPTEEELHAITSLAKDLHALVSDLRRARKYEKELQRGVPADQLAARAKKKVDDDAAAIVAALGEEPQEEGLSRRAVMRAARIGHPAMLRALAEAVRSGLVYERGFKFYLTPPAAEPTT